MTHSSLQFRDKANNCWLTKDLLVEDIYKYGATAFNLTRLQHPSWIPVLQGVTFDLVRATQMSALGIQEGIDFHNVDLRKVNFITGMAHVNMRKAFLGHIYAPYTNAERADLSGADLQDSMLRYAILRGASLCRANLQRVNLQHACLCNADLQEALLCGADIRKADLRNANLQNIVYQKGILIGVNLQGANLANAYLSHVDLTGANWQDANVTNAIFNAVHMSVNDLCDKQKASMLMCNISS